MKGNSSKKKLIVAASVVGVVLLAAIISVVAVFAAPQQKVNSQVSVSYSVTDVSATVGARFAVANSNIVDAGSITFTANQETTTGDLNFIDTDDSTAIPSDIGLTSTNNYVVFEFKFDNNSTLGFNATLTAIPETVTNMVLSYQVSATALEDFDSVTGTVFYDQVNDTKVNNVASVTTAVAGGVDSVSYIYIKVAIDDLNTAAQLNGAFAWNLSAVV